MNTNENKDMNKMAQVRGSQWVIKMQENAERMPDTRKEVEFWMKRSIYRIPPSVTDMNTKAYKPQFVSIGPYHYGEVHLKGMEEHKERALVHILRRSGKPLNLFIQSLSHLVKDFKESYDSLDDFPEWTSDEDFLQLMILDGCFMLEVMRIATHLTIDEDYAPNDPIFSNHGKHTILHYIKRDMLMLENQLPLSLLCNLVAIETNHKSYKAEQEVMKLVLNFYDVVPGVKNIRKLEGKCLHVLDIFRKSLFWPDPEKRIRKIRGDYYKESEVTILSAMELTYAGIQFEKSKTRSIKDIWFNRGTLELPVIVVNDATESMFLNLIAFEHSHVGAGKEVTSYISFMDSIINNAKDVSLLHSSGIIQSAIGSDEAVAKMFNSLSKALALDPDSSLHQVHMELHRYCRQWSKRWRLNFINTYNRSPWAIVSVFAAIVLFALTFIQTIYTVYPYYNPLKR